MGFMDSPDGMAERAQRREGAPRARSVAFVTSGCAKNEVDTAHMRERVEAAGHAVVDDPALADAVVVNTCSFIQAATEESIEAVFDVAGLPRMEDGSAALVVAGCMPARYGEALEDELSEARAFVPCAREDDIVQVLEGMFAQLPESAPGTPGAVGGGRAGAGDGNAPTAAGDGAAEGGAGVQPDGGFPAEADAAGARGAVSAYVKISDGCDRFCSYCTIPLIRGRYRSFPLADVCAEVDAHVARGVREIVLVAQDTGRWGTDFDAPSSLAALLSALAERHPRTWFRVMYVQPEGRGRRAAGRGGGPCQRVPLLRRPAAARGPGTACRHEPHAGRARNSRTWRAASGSACRARCCARRSSRDSPARRRSSSRSLCDFVEEAPFDYVGVFAYSREEGTRAFGLPGQLDEDEKAERAQRLRDVADAACLPRIAARVGREMDVLVEGREEDGQLFGRAMCQAPEVDGVVYLDAGEVGQVVRVRIVDTLLYEMEGERA